MSGELGVAGRDDEWVSVKSRSSGPLVPQRMAVRGKIPVTWIFLRAAQLRECWCQRRSSWCAGISTCLCSNQVTRIPMCIER